MSLPRRLIAEFIGSALLLAIVVGSGIMAERLANGNAAIALLANALATGAGLVAIIFMFGHVSGAHFNPVVSLSEAIQKKLHYSDILPYFAVQITGAFLGVLLAHIMFEMPIVSLSIRARNGSAQLFSETIATFGLIAVILGCNRHRPDITPFAVASYIVSAYWFTASTSFANPAVTIARAFTNTFAGIRLIDVPGFVLAQISGAVFATFIFTWLFNADHVKVTDSTMS